MAKTQSELLRDCNEALKPWYPKLHDAKEKRATEERIIRSFGPDGVERLQAETDKMQRELSAGLGSFAQMRRLQLQLEEAKKDRVDRDAAWKRWENANQEVETIEAMMERIRDQHRLVK